MKERKEGKKEGTAKDESKKRKGRKQTGLTSRRDLTTRERACETAVYRQAIFHQPTIFDFLSPAHQPPWRLTQSLGGGGGDGGDGCNSLVMVTVV
jgi:hypothetical protein